MKLLEQLDSGLIEEIEAFLRAQVKRTAHPLVSKTTEELIREALATAPKERSRPQRPDPLPGSLWKIVPDWMVSARRMVRHNTVYEISPRQHIELIIGIIEKWGWSKGRLRTKSGCRCIVGAQLILLRMGYGSEHTMKQAGQMIQSALYARGVSEPYWEWNDDSRRTKHQVIGVLREAAR